MSGRSKKRFVKLRGKRWTLISGNPDPGNWGDTDSAKHIIMIHRKAQNVILLDAQIHESLHACFPDLAEEAVDEGGRDIARLLWNEGWRPPQRDDRR